MPGSRDSADASAAENHSLFMTFLKHGGNANSVPTRNNENFSTEETSRRNALLRKQLSKALEKDSSEFPLLPPTTTNQARQKVQ